MSCICHFFKVLARRAGLLTAVAAAAFFLGAPASEASARTAAPAYPAAEVGGNPSTAIFPFLSISTIRCRRMPACTRCLVNATSSPAVSTWQ